MSLIIKSRSIGCSSFLTTLSLRAIQLGCQFPQHWELCTSVHKVRSKWRTEFDLLAYHNLRVPRKWDRCWSKADLVTTSFPGFSPTRPYGAREEREPGNEVDLVIRSRTLPTFCEVWNQEHCTHFQPFLGWHWGRSSLPHHHGNTSMRHHFPSWGTGVVSNLGVE